MSHPIETFTSKAIFECRQAVFGCTVENNAHLSPEIYVSWDDQKGEVNLTADSAENMLLHLDATVAKDPRWFSLNIGMGRQGLNAGDVLGVVLETECNHAFNSVPFCRTALEDGHGDTYWQDGLNLEAGRQISTLLHTIEPGDALEKSVFHTLVIPLHHEDFSLTLRDMRLFVLDAARGLRSTPLQAASAG